jgi:general secretion pathway protein N
VATSTQWGDSSFEEMRWQRTREAGRPWAIAGALVGLVLGLIVFAPAAWLASAVFTGTRGHILLADASGTVWSGSAVLVLAGGEGARDARSLPGRINWSLRPAGLTSLRAELRHECCINDALRLTLQPGLGSFTTHLQGTPGWISQWPADWLGGLGTPWNTVQLAGALRLSSPGLTLQSVQGRWRVEGRAALDIVDVSSRVSTLARLGSYRLNLTGDPAGAAQLQLTSASDSSLQLSGAGSVGPGGLRFKGEAHANAADEAALSNLLNIIGRRDGARSVISIE